jgi:tRNA(fMet)-specific endonuclease VapC
VFFVLDPDHFSALDRESSAGESLEKRRSARDAELFISVITVKEVMRGWLALLNGIKRRKDEVAVYERLQRSAELIGGWDILPWDSDCLRCFELLRTKKVKGSTMDLKVASVALAHDATLLTRNAADFARVPGLKFENWLD